MNPEVKESESVDTSSPGYEVGADTPLLESSNDDQVLLPPSTSASASSTADQASEQFRQITARIYTFLASLPEYLSDFFGEYKRPLITLGLIFGSIVSVKLTLAVLDAINDIPLLAPTFELIGFGYTAWFIYRYLWRASNRQELTRDFNAFKDQVLGKNSPNP